MTGVWEGARFVVIDTETTGLHDTARILSIAVYCLEDGATARSWSTLVNPGEYGATHIHGLDPRKLARAKPFATHADHLRDLLTSDTGTVYLVAHNIAYDAARLTYEYSLLGQDLPTVVLLDTRALIRAAGITTSGSTLDDIAASFGLSNAAKHEANADALIVREVTLRCLALLPDGSDLSDYASTIASAPTPATPRPKVTAAHAALHDLPLINKRDRDRALGGCLVLSCPDLHKRIEDGITNSTSARACYQWALVAMNDATLTRYQRGLLVAGAARALNGWRDNTTNPGYGMLLDKAVAVLATQTTWAVCSGTDLCDYCQAGKPERCRFTNGTRKLLWPALYASKGNLVIDNAHAYLTGTGKTPLTRKSWWGSVHSHAPDTADSVAVTVAAGLRKAGRGDLARPAIEKLWKTGQYTPRLTTVYAAIVEEDTISSDKLKVFRDAEAICATGLAARTAIDTNAWAAVVARQSRLLGRINAATRKAPASPYNTRPPHRPRFVKP